MNTKQQAVKELRQIPGIGPSLAEDLWNIGISSINDLRGRDPQELYDRSNAYEGSVQDRCVLYAFRCSVYYADTPKNKREPEKLKWWNWQDKKIRK